MSSMGFFKRWLGGADASAPRTSGRRQAPVGTRMLVVDDSPTICAVLGRMLEQDGYAVRKAADGEHALELAKAELPELIFLDIVLPGINGFAVLRALRHDPLTAHIPIVMISGNQQATEQFYVQRYGADGFMKKPFGRAEVQASIDVLVRAGRLPARAAEPLVAATPAPVEIMHDVVSGMAA
ncbi:response regulator [Rhodanobacter aciditrophus]|uniref:response regulator n=1 Tax=Rhodanobacter aciditrophus TaxID=1623218 RepID=UPI003CF8A35C